MFGNSLTYSSGWIRLIVVSWERKQQELEQFTRRENVAEVLSLSLCNTCRSLYFNTRVATKCDHFKT